MLRETFAEIQRGFEGGLSKGEGLSKGGGRAFEGVRGEGRRGGFRS